MADQNAVLDRLEAVCSRLERIAAKGGSGAGADADPEVPPEGYLDFKAMWDKEGSAFLAATAAIDGYPDADSLCKILNDAFETIMKYMALQNKVKKPQMPECIAFNQPMINAMNAADGLIKTRKRALFKFDNIHKALYEIISSCTWVSMAPPNGLPAQHTKGQYEACDFHFNRIMMKEPAYKPWAKAAKAFMKRQADVVKEHYKMGIEFSGKEDIGNVDADASVTAPPAQKQEEELESKEQTTAPGRKQKKVDGVKMLAELQKGLGATAGLKKVDRSMKNKYNRANIKGTVSVGPKKAKAKKKMPDAKKYKQGPFTWFWQYYKEGLVDITDADNLTIKNGIYICNSLNCNFRIGPKVKSVVIDSCQRVQIELNDIVTSVEIVNCKNVTVWVKGVVPSVNLDKSESPRVIFVTPESWNHAEGKNPQVVYSNVTAANIELPGATLDDQRKEIPLVEQFLFEYTDGQAKYLTLDHGD